MALIRRIDSFGLVKGYVDDGNFDGFLIRARKGLLRLHGPIEGEKEREQKNRKGERKDEKEHRLLSFLPS